MRDILDLLLSVESTFNLSIVLKDRVLKFNFRFASECMAFYIGLKNAKKEKTETLESVHKIFKFNVDPFYYAFTLKKKVQIIKMTKDICKGILTAGTVAEYNKALTRLTSDFSFICDAFYSKRPFQIHIFRIVIIQIHKNVKASFESKWNSSHSDVQTTDCLNFAEAMFGYQTILSRWKLIDGNFKDWQKPITNRFLYCLFEKSKEMMVSILTNLGSTYYHNEGKIISGSLDGFESHLSFFVSHFQLIPIKSFAVEIVEYVGRISSMFFITMQEYLFQKTANKEIYMVILNSNLYKAIRLVQKSISNFTKDALTVEMIKIYMNDDYLIVIFQKIHNLAKILLKKALVRELVEIPLRKIISFWDLNIEVCCIQIKEDLRSAYSMLINDFIFKELTYYVINMLVVEYVLFISRFASTLKPSDSKRLITKITDDCQTLSDQCDETSMENCQKIKNKIKIIKSYFCTLKIDETIASFVKMQIFFRKKIKKEEMLELIKAKCFFSGEIQKYILAFNSQIKEHRPKRFTQESIQTKKKFQMYTSFFVLVALIKFSRLIRKD